MKVALAQLPRFIDAETERVKRARAAVDIMTPEEVKERAEAQMRLVDSLTPEVRALVNEFGLNAVKKRLGMSARAMRHDIVKSRDAIRAMYEEEERAKALANLELEL